jgi:hypothetical protein
MIYYETPFRNCTILWLIPITQYLYQPVQDQALFTVFEFANEKIEVVCYTVSLQEIDVKSTRNTQGSLNVNAWQYNSTLPFIAQWQIVELALWEFVAPFGNLSPFQLSLEQSGLSSIQISYSCIYSKT